MNINSTAWFLAGLLIGSILVDGTEPSCEFARTIELMEWFK